MKRILFLLLVCGLTLWATTALAEELTLDQAVQLALKNNQLLQAAQQDTAAAQWGFRRSISGWLPHASFQWAWEHPDPRTFDRADQGFRATQSLGGAGTGTGTSLTGTGSSAQRTLYRDNYSNQFQIVQPLFNASTEYLAIRSGSINERVARLTELDQALQLTRNVKQAYYAAAQNYALIGVARESLSLAQESLRLSQARVEVGQAAQSEVLRWEAEVANAEGALVGAENTYSQAMMALAHLIGASYDQKYELTALPQNVTPAELATAEQSAGAGAQTPLSVDRHPAVAAARGNIDLAEVEYERTWGSMLPSANFTYTYDWQTDDTPWPHGVRSWTMGVGVSIPIFQGFGAVTGMEQTDHQVSSARLRVEDVKRTLLQQAYAARLNLHAARVQVDSGQKAVKSAAANLDLVKSQMEVGIATLLQLLDAELTRRNAESTLITAMANFHTALADWEYLTAQAPAD